jgi:hypothetical protein
LLGEQSRQRHPCLLHLRLQLGIGILPEVDELGVVVDGLVAVAEGLVELAEAVEDKGVPVIREPKVDRALAPAKGLEGGERKSAFVELSPPRKVWKEGSARARS